MAITLGMFNVPLAEIKKPLQDLLEAVLGLNPPLVLSADATAVNSNTLTAQSGLAQNVTSGVVYSFRIRIKLTATLAEGWKIDLDGGSAAMTSIEGTAKGYDGSSLALIVPVSALTTNISPQDGFSGEVEIEGSFQPSSTGTFAPRIAQLSHSSGSVQVLKGSSSLVQASA